VSFVQRLALIWLLHRSISLIVLALLVMGHKRSASNVANLASCSLAESNLLAWLSQCSLIIVCLESRLGSPSTPAVPVVFKCGNWPPPHGMRYTPPMPPELSHQYHISINRRLRLVPRLQESATVTLAALSATQRTDSTMQILFPFSKIFGSFVCDPL